MLSISALAALVVIEPPAWLPAGTATTTAVALLTIGLFASGVIAEAIGALVFFLIAMLGMIAPPAVIFAGFSSTAFWIIFGGLIIGMSIRHTGLGEHIAGVLQAHLPTRYSLLITATVVASLLFAFLMPGAMGRMVLLVPIALALSERLGFAEHSNGQIALVLATVFGTHVGSFAILPSNTPNVVWAGAMQSIHGIEIGYLDYLAWHFPVLGLVRSGLLIVLIVLWFPDHLPTPSTAQSTPSAMAKDQRITAWLLLAALGFWMTDFVHGVGPAWVALAVACVLLLSAPRLVPEKAVSKLDIGPLLLVAGVLGLGAVLAHSGVGAAAFNRLLPHLPLAPGADALNYAAVSLGGVLLAILTAMPGVPAIGVPLGDALAAATGWSVRSVLIILAASYSTYILPYQAPPILIGAQLGRIPWGVLTRFMLVFALLSIVLVFPLHFGWLSLIGVLTP